MITEKEIKYLIKRKRPYTEFSNKKATAEINKWFNFTDFEEFKEEFFRVSEIVKKTFKKWKNIPSSQRFTDSNMKLDDFYYFYYSLNRAMCKYGFEVFYKELKSWSYFNNNIRL